MNIVDEDKLELKTFSVRERNPKIIRHAKKAIFTMKHLDNMSILLLPKNIYMLNQNLVKILFLKKVIMFGKFLVYCSILKL